MPDSRSAGPRRRAPLWLAFALLACACARTARVPGGAAAAPRSATSPEACRACQGVWGRHGLADVESCVCRARDAGKRCRDGDECEGDCLLAEPAPDVEVTDPGPPRRGRFVGLCAELVTTFGCRARVPDGALRAGPVSLDEPPPVMCVD